MEYFLYTRANPQIKQALFKDDIISVQRSNYDPLRPLRVIVHGFQSNHSSDVNTYIRAAYLESSDVNVISVDWSTGSDRISINYGKSEEDVKTYGKILASFLDFLQSHYNNTFDRTTIVGHSLGAHLAGIAGKYVTGQLDMIMGLDPAGPLYIRLLEYNRISKGDAKYVQIIHTNTANYGFTYPLGDTDFYPNYGATQPECLSDVSTGCSHVMVVKVECVMKKNLKTIINIF